MRGRYSDEEFDRARGALLGLAVGDALGAALEWLHPNQIRQRYGGELRDLVQSTLWARGEWTDDTAMALELARSIVECGEYDEDDVFARYALWARSGPKDIGGTVSAAVMRARSADESRAAALRHHEDSGGKSAGNGSLMRTAPIALRYSRDGKELERVSRLDSTLTHHDPLAADACVFFNQTVAALLRQKRLPGSSSAAGTAAASALTASPDELETEAQEQVGFVLTALRIGYAAAFGHETFEQAVVFAANLGGDADTNAAVAGALAGARFGAGGIPERWLEPLLDRASISGLATRLLRS